VHCKPCSLGRYFGPGKGQMKRAGKSGRGIKWSSIAWNDRRSRLEMAIAARRERWRLFSIPVILLAFTVASLGAAIYASFVDQ
jgi:hypothetical protein